MTSTSQPTPGNDAYAAFDQSQRMWHLWLDLATRMSSAGGSFDHEAAPSDAARQMRGAMFGAMAQSAEQFMRSPQFLEMMRDWISASISCRKQLNQFFTGVHHSTESVAQQDVENLLLSLRHLEGRMVERTEQLVNKLESIEQRLDRLEQVRAAHDHAAQE